MGDYDGEFNGSLWRKHGKNVNLPTHQVVLDGFWMSPYKVTMADFDFFQSITKASKAQDQSENSGRLPGMPAYLDWYQAHDFCAWLARVTGQPFGLPTEAQWEYAARNLGSFVPVATDNGSWRFENGGDDHDEVSGLNVAFYKNRVEFAREAGIRNADAGMPIASFPPNPLGLYDMTDGGTEWVNDWYDPDYYQYSPVHNPTGPADPVYKSPDTNDEYAKVLRGVYIPQYPILKPWTVYRSYSPPSTTLPLEVGGEKLKLLTGKTARCVLNIDPAA